MADFWDVDPQPTAPTAPALPPAPAHDDDFWQGTSPDPGKDISGYVSAGGRSTWGDIPHAVAAGVHGGLADIAGAGAALSSPEAAAKWRSEALAQQQAQAASESELTPAAQQPGFFKHPMTSTAEAIPPMAMVLAPAAVAGPAAPFVAGAGMGIQGMGGTYNEMMNRAVSQGMSPEEAHKQIQASGALPASAAINAAAGLFPEVAGPLSKIAVSGPVKQALLGSTADTVTFGVTNAMSDIGTQKAEIGMGTRKDIDTGEVGEAFTSGLEQGVGFAGFHVARGIHEGMSGTGRDMTQKPGQSQTSPRTPDATKKTDAKPRASTSVQAGAMSTPAPASSPTADPMIQAGLKGAPVAKPITPRVKPQDQAVEQPGVATTAAAPPPSPTEAPPAADTTGGAPPPTAAPEASPAPAPAPISASDDPTIRAREHAELLDPKHPRVAMIYPQGVQPLEIAKKAGRFHSVELDSGQTVQYDRTKITKDKIADAAEDGTLDAIVHPPEAPQSVAGAKPAPTSAEAPERVADVGAQAAPPPPPEARPEAAERPQPAAVQTEPVKPTVVEPTPRVTEEEPAPLPVREGAPKEEAPPPPVDPLAGSTMLAKNKAGIELHQMSDGSYKVRKMDGTIVDNVPPGQAKAMFPDAVKEAAPKEEATVRADQIPPELRAAAEFQRQRRVLEAQGEQEERARAAQAEAQDKAAAQEAAKPVGRQTKEPEDQQPGKDEKRREDNIANNAVADSVARENLPKAEEANALETARGSGGEASRKAVMARVKEMVRQATEKGFKFVKQIKDRKDPAEAHSASSILLHEANRLANIKVAKVSDYKRYLDRERELLKGEAAKGDVLRERRAAGKEFAAAKGTAKETAVEDTDRAAEGAGAIEHPDVAEEYEKAKERVADEKVAQEPGEKRELTPQQKLAQEASERAKAKLAEREAREAAAKEEKEKPAEAEEGAYTAVKARTAGFQVEKKRPKWSREEALVGPEYYLGGEPKDDGPPGEGEIQLEGALGKVNVAPSRSTDAETAINETYKVGRYAAGAPQMMGKLRNIVIKMVGDTPVHYLSNDEMNRVMGYTDGKVHTYGAFHEEGLNGKPVIILNADHMSADTPLHEAFHAATDVAIANNPGLKNLMERLRVEVVKGIDRSKPDYKVLSYYLRSYKEFLTGMMTHPRMQELLKGIKISDKLARDIDIPKWRKMTMWEGALAIIRDALGLGPRDTSAIEAAMSLSEQLMWRDPRGAGELMAGVGRLAKSQMAERGGWARNVATTHERDQEAFLKTPKEQLSRVRNINKEMATEYAKDKWTNASTITDKHVKVLAGTWMDNIHGHLFEDAKGRILEAINHARDKVSATYKKLMGDDTDIINRGYLLDKMFAGRMSDYQRLVSMSNTYNIHADRAAPRVPKNAEDAARKYWQRNEKYGEARKIYDSLPPELQKRYTDEKNFYNGKFGAIGKVMMDKVLPLFDPPKGSTLEEVTARAKANDLTDEDWKHYEKLGVDGSLRKALSMINKKDAYFNAQRDGRYVVTGRYEMPTGGSEKDFTGEELPDNKREFNSESEAHAYVTNTHMHAVTQEVNYWTDKATGVTKRVPADFATSDPGTETTKYQVRLERQNTQMADSKAMALKNRAAMEADGVKDLSGVLDKRNEHAWSKLNSADQKAIERKINSNPNMTDAEKQHLRDTSRQMMLAGQGGMSSHFIHARKVAGAKFDTASGLHAYSKAANYSMARDAHSQELNEAMERLDDHEEANRGDVNATRRSVVANEYRDRVYGANKDALNSKVPGFMQKLMSYAFINFLARPSHVFLSQIHPYIYSVPMMGARHGYWKALQAQKQAMKDLGGVTHNLWEGAKAGYDVARAGRQKDIDKAVAMAHGADPIDRMIAGLKNPEERKFLQDMRSTEHLHSAFDASVFAGDGMDRTNAVVRQFTDAMEANNRLSTALAAYRLQKGMHGDKAEALRYARRIIEESHGVYSPTNTAPIFKNPIVKGALQFRQMPMNLALNTYRNIGKAAMGDSEARWTLTYQLGTAALLGGMGGMPMDLPKLAGLGVQAVGGPSPADWADKEQRLLTSWLGETGANLINEGLPSMMGPLGPSVGHRTGFDAGFFFGEPSSEKVDDLYAYAFKMFAGASGGLAANWITALHNFEHGDFGRMAETALPGSLADIAKGVRLATEGTTVGKGQLLPASYGEAILQMLGFSPIERERAFAGHFALQKELKAEQAAKPKTKAEELKAKEAAKRSVLGVPVSKKQRATASEYEGAYQ